MVICYDLYGSERISVSQMVFLQFTILISFFIFFFFCLYAVENPKSTSKLPTRTPRSSTTIYTNLRLNVPILVLFKMYQDTAGLLNVLRTPVNHTDLSQSIFGEILIC